LPASPRPRRCGRKPPPLPRCPPSNRLPLAERPRQRLCGQPDWMVMRLVVGLGNPGARYARNRHNIGFMAVDAIARRHGFPGFRSRFKGELSEGPIGGERRLLLKPQTFMNASGESVAEAARFFKISVSEIIVIHDEIDLRPGKLRVKCGGGTAGHKGLR